jgi:MOSC domain-containing protein YiiM
MPDQARVLSIYTATTAEGPMIPVDAVRAVLGKGLEGDRYATRSGTFSNQPGTGRDVTLIEIEALEALKRDYSIDLGLGESRRNVITRGVALNHLVGREFTVGDVTLRGIRLCEPCMHLERLTRPGVLKGLIHRGGLRTEIVVGGLIRVGDAIDGGLSTRLLLP